MDPDRALADLRQAIADLDNVPVNDTEAVTELTTVIMDLFVGLDRHLSREGYLPVSWSGAKPSAALPQFMREKVLQ